ncbi:IreB family regulatory phosphoprotein [Tissierella carlieri]
MNNKFNETMKFEPPKENIDSVEEIIFSVFSSLEEKGYDPINQIIGYILSGDPTYITSHNNARSTICRIERDELLEELLKSYLKNSK